MSITITVARSVSFADYARIEELADLLRMQDRNFKDRVVTVQWGPATTVSDTHDRLRGALLQLLVENVLYKR